MGQDVTLAVVTGPNRSDPFRRQRDQRLAKTDDTYGLICQRAFGKWHRPPLSGPSAAGASRSLATNTSATFRHGPINAPPLDERCSRCRSKKRGAVIPLPEDEMRNTSQTVSPP